jgi:hypothetical protein
MSYYTTFFIPSDRPWVMSFPQCKGYLFKILPDCSTIEKESDLHEEGCNGGI